MRWGILTACLAILVSGESIHAGGVVSETLKAAGKAVARKLGGEVVEEGTKNVSKRLIRELAKEGAEQSAKRAGSVAAGTASSLGRSAASGFAGSTGLVATYGDDALRAASRVSSQNARRLELMAGELKATGKASEVIALIAKNGAGDQVVDYLWRNKATLVGGAAVTTLLLNPEAAIAAGGELGSAVVNATGEYVAKPAVEGTLQHVIAPVIGGSAINAWLFFAVGILVIAGTVGFWIRTRKLRRAASIVSFVTSRP